MFSNKSQTKGYTGALLGAFMLFGYVALSARCAYAIPLQATMIKDRQALLPFVYPVMGPRMSSDYGMRKHPVKRVRKHHHGVDCQINPALLDTARAIAVPVPAGGAMFFYGMLPHETPPNRSPERRRALQFHFRGAQSRLVDEEVYDREFRNREGIPASCRSASRRGF